MASTSPTQEVYQHLEASKQQFRLLVLQSGSGFDRIQAKLYVASFENEPVYETISYCWGDASQSSIIELDEISTRVPASSVAALSKMRRPGKERTLWIDAICINQQDPVERAQQVEMMSMIYSKARGNLIFLGEDDGSTWSALESLQRIYSDLVEETQNFQQLDGTILKTGTAPPKALTELKCEIDVPALKTFFSLPWFRRLWVFQEVVLAPSNTCYIGSFDFSFLLPVRTATWVLGSKKIAHELDKLLWESNCVTAYHFVDPLGSCARGAIPQMENLVAACLYLKATEPRDYLYGMLGIHQRHRPSLHPLLVPNYLRPIEDVFRDGTKFLVGVRQHIRVWLWIHWEDDTEFENTKRPSWAIDWSQLRAAKSLDMHLKSFNAGCEGTVPHSLRFADADENIVFVKGLRLAGIVDTTSTLRITATDNRHSDTTWLKECLDMMLASPGAEDAEVLLSTVLTAFDNGGELSETTRINALAEFMRFMNLDSRLFFRAPTWGEGDESIVLATKFQRAWIRTCLDHKAFVTSDGRAGVGPSVVRKGDVVALFTGFHVPYVLRPSGRNARACRIVGACYVSGVMEGNVMRQHLEAGEPDEVFWIR